MLGPLEALIRLNEISNGGEDIQSDKKLVAEVERCQSELSQELVDRHTYLVSRYGLSAVAPIKGGACAGCFVAIPSSRRNKVGEDIYSCEQCGRLLYDEAKVYDLLNS